MHGPTRRKHNEKNGKANFLHAVGRKKSVFHWEVFSNMYGSPKMKKIRCFIYIYEGAHPGSWYGFQFDLKSWNFDITTKTFLTRLWAQKFKTHIKSFSLKFVKNYITAMTIFYTSIREKQLEHICFSHIWGRKARTQGGFLEVESFSLPKLHLAPSTENRKCRISFRLRCALIQIKETENISPMPPFFVHWRTQNYKNHLDDFNISALLDSNNS